MEKKWWQEAVVYQVYPRSFMDSDGDGIGDLQGIIGKLDYLAELGINVIWLSPVYQSPNYDNGYDISDYYRIMSDFGSMEDMDELIEAADKLGIKIIMDLVANHTSFKHEWFQKALADQTSKYRDYYIFRENKGDYPNDLKSTFLGPAWTLDKKSDEYYLHLFTPEQPDLNWHNVEVRQEMHKMINWWLDKGIGGFRLDVIDLIAKHPDKKITSDGPELHEYIQEMTRETFSKYDVLTVGETWSADIEKAKQYSNLDGTEFSMIFNFSHILLDQEGDEKWDYKSLDLEALKQDLSSKQIELYKKGWNSLFWNNHDLPRIVSRWGNDSSKFRYYSATSLATLLHLMQGTPYIYQGEEIGMTNVKFDSIEKYRDVETLNMYKERIKKGYQEEEIMDSIYKIGRDNARTPMQWNNSENAGFSDGKPWLKVNPNYSDINVEDDRKSTKSVFKHYQHLIHLRRFSEYKNIIRDGEYKVGRLNHPEIFDYTRNLNNKELYVICNFYDNEIKLDMDFSSYQVISNNYNNFQGTLHAYQAVVLYKINQEEIK